MRERQEGRSEGGRLEFMSPLVKRRRVVVLELLTLLCTIYHDWRVRIWRFLQLRSSHTTHISCSSVLATPISPPLPSPHNIHSPRVIFDFNLALSPSGLFIYSFNFGYTAIPQGPKDRWMPGFGPAIVCGFISPFGFGVDFTTFEGRWQRRNDLRCVLSLGGC